MEYMNPHGASVVARRNLPKTKKASGTSNGKTAPAHFPKIILLNRSGLYLIKSWFWINQKEQRRRFEKLRSQHFTQRKIYRLDLALLEKWKAYTRAKEALSLKIYTAITP